MIESIHFENFKVLKNTTLKLRPFNVIVGPNGSGKSTALKAMCINEWNNQHVFHWLSAGSKPDQLKLVFRGMTVQPDSFELTVKRSSNNLVSLDKLIVGPNLEEDAKYRVDKFINCFSFTSPFALDPKVIASDVALTPSAALGYNGGNFVAVLDALRDAHEDIFNKLKKELREWLPEFDNIIFTTPSQGMRGFKLRQSATKHDIPADQLSDGTLIALALLAIVNNPMPPSVICLEEPDRGIHPRLLRDIRDSLYRLAYPDQYGIDRAHVQVIVTTHSPYFLDLFQDHPEEIIIAEKQADGSAKFRSLADEPNLAEMLGDAPLGEIWYSGILGGVPKK